MKRVRPWAAMGIFITVGLLTVAAGHAEKKDEGCSLKTLKGRYLFASMGAARESPLISVDLR